MILKNKIYFNHKYNIWKITNAKPSVHVCDLDFFNSYKIIEMMLAPDVQPHYLDMGIVVQVMILKIDRYRECAEML